MTLVRKRYCKGHKHRFIGMAGHICKLCDYIGIRDWKVLDNYKRRKRVKGETPK